MPTREAHRRLREAAETVASCESKDDPEAVLWRAWGLLRGLRSDEFPEELRAQFDYLRHEMSLRKEQEMTAREVNFLLRMIRELELKWIEPPGPVAIPAEE
jgi:hypothetical protein